MKVSIVRVMWHQGRPSAPPLRQHKSPVTKRIVKTAAHIAGTTDVSTQAGGALYATAASRLRAPKLEALRAFHVQCSSLTPAGVVCSSLRRAAAGEGAAAQDLQPGEVPGACRSGEGAGARGLQSGEVAMCSSARVGVGEGAEACSSINSGRPGTPLGQLSGTWLGLWVRASGGAAQSTSMFIWTGPGFVSRFRQSFSQ